MEDPGRGLAVAGSILWVGVEAAGLVAGIACLALSPRLRRPAVCVVVATGVSLLARGAMVLALNWASERSRTGAFTHDEFMRFLRACEFGATILGVAANALLILAALLWRVPRDAGAVGSPTPAPVPAAIAGGEATFGAPPTSPTSPTPRAVPGEPMPPLSAGVRIAIVLTCGVLGSAGMIAGMIVGQGRANQGAGAALMLLGLALVIAECVVVGMTFHALWKTIQPPANGRGIAGIARATPAKAIGLLFVPLFNFYWAFQAIPGLATDLNRTLDELRIPGPRASRALGIAWCVCAILAIIPFVGFVVAVAGLVVVPMFLGAAIGAANALRRA